MFIDTVQKEYLSLNENQKHTEAIIRINNCCARVMRTNATAIAEAAVKSSTIW